MTMKECITHHHACDCREAEFARLMAENERLIELNKVAVAQKRKRVYVLIGNEPFDDCMRRITETIEQGCEPHVQPLMKLNALSRDPLVRYDWTAQRLKDVARWANGWVWKKAPFDEYDRHRRTVVPEMYDGQQGLFV